MGAPGSLVSQKAGDIFGHAGVGALPSLAGNDFWDVRGNGRHLKSRSPVVRSDDRDFVLCCLNKGAWTKSSLEQEWGETGPIRVRMGLHTGFAHERDNDYFGPTLNRVARLQGIGHGQQT